MPAEDDTTICNVVGDDGLECGQEFPDEVAWQEHYEDEHAWQEEAEVPGSLYPELGDDLKRAGEQMARHKAGLA